jgi:DNA-3-methyladenine glycosylase II
LPVPLLRLPEPYDFDVSTERFRAFGPDSANLWHEGGLHRVVRGRELRIEAAQNGVRVEPLGRAAEPVVRRLLGADFDLAAFTEFAQGDPALARLAARLAGFRPPLAPDPFEALVGSITAQQVSLQAAFAVRSRLIERFGERSEHAWAFPTQARIAAAREDELMALGFSRRKAEYVLGLARSGLDLEGLAALADEEVKRSIVSLRGLGEWTADWFLARYLARPRAWPAGDLGLRKAVSAYYGNGRELTTEEVRALGARFEPFQNLSAHYLLTGLRMVGT